MAEWLVSMNLSPWMFLIIVNVFLLLFGIFIEPLPRRDGAGAHPRRRWR